MQVFYFTGLWIFTTLLPLMVLNNKKEDKPLGTRDYVGWGLWALGFLFETIADHQKSAFKGNPDNAVSVVYNRVYFKQRLALVHLLKRQTIIL